MINSRVNVESLLDRLKDRLGIETDKRLAEILGAKPDDIYRARQRQSVPKNFLGKVIDFCMERDISLEYLFVGQDPDRFPSEKPYCSSPILMQTIYWQMLDVFREGKIEPTFEQGFFILSSMFNKYSGNEEEIDKEQLKHNIRELLRVVK